MHLKILSRNNLEIIAVPSYFDLLMLANFIWYNFSVMKITCIFMQLAIATFLHYDTYYHSAPFLINLLGVGVVVIMKATLPGRGLAIALKIRLTLALDLIG